LSIALEAVKHNGEALQYVRKQTLDICREAHKQNPFIDHYIKDYHHQDELIREIFNGCDFLQHTLPHSDSFVRGDVHTISLTHVKHFVKLVHVLNEIRSEIRW